MSVKEISQFPTSQTVHRYLFEEIPSEILESNKSTTRKASESAQKSTFASQMRQTMHMKRYKYQKLAYQSKPIAICNYHENFFAMEPMKSDNLDKVEARKTNSTNKMMPINSNTWVNNSKKLQKKWLTGKRGISVDESIFKDKLFERSSFYDMNENIVHDMKEYFQSMKQYLKNQKKKNEKERKIRMYQTKIGFDERDNLNIIQLKPNTQHNLRRRQTVTEEESFLQRETNSPLMIEYQSSNNLEKSPERGVYSLKSSMLSQSSKASSKIFKRKIVKKEEYHYIFGLIKEGMSEQEISKLKNLYYRDFLWKICYNRGFLYQPSIEVYRYYVGKGNNSRLIRRIMSKRTWWVEDARQQNAHFIWTQLKIYDAYKNQKSLKPAEIQQSNFLTNMDEDFEMMNPQTAAPTSRLQEYLKNQTDRNKFLMRREKYQKWRNYIKNKNGVERKPQEDMKQRLFVKLQTKTSNHKITNHLQFSRVVGNKKALYRTMQAYFSYRSVQGYLPLTFHITGGLEDEQYLRFLRDFYKRSKEGHNWWIVKPGELSNRGRDIKYCGSLKEIKDQIKQKKTNSNGSVRTYIVQSYLEKPFLYQGRKFDLRHYLMITSTQGKIRGYFYQQGYVRTTSFPYSLNSHNPGVHLTNDAVQKYLPQYSKFEKANKLSYDQLNQYMLKLNPGKGFYELILPQIRKIGKDIIHAAFPFIDPERRINNFEIFGIDVMIDSDYKCWLIEVNTNPCIEVNCGVLSSIIPSMLDNAFAIGLDSIICPPSGKTRISQNNYVQQNKFELVFDEQIDGEGILLSYKNKNIQIGKYGDDDDNYQSCEEEDYEG